MAYCINAFRMPFYPSADDCSPIRAKHTSGAITLRGIAKFHVTNFRLSFSMSSRWRDRFWKALAQRTGTSEDVNCFVNSSAREFYQSAKYRQRVDSLQNKTVLERAVALRYSPEQINRVDGIYGALRRALTGAKRFDDFELDTSLEVNMLSLEDLRSDEINLDVSAYEQEVGRVRENFPCSSEEGFLVVEPRMLQKKIEES